MTWTYSQARHVEAPDGDLPRGSEGLTGAAVYTERVRDRMQAAEASKPDAARPRDPVAEMWFEMHERWAREAKAAEQVKIAARAERAAVDAIAKKLVDDCGFTPSDAARRARELRRK